MPPFPSSPQGKGFQAQPPFPGTSLRGDPLIQTKVLISSGRWDQEKSGQGLAGGPGSGRGRVGPMGEARAEAEPGSSLEWCQPRGVAVGEGLQWVSGGVLH